MTTNNHIHTAHVPDIGKPRVLIIGGGFAGIQLVKNLNKDNFQVVMLDRHNYHTFQPLLYQVATAGLEPDSIAGPLRKVFDNHKNFFFRIAKVSAIQPEQKTVQTNIGQIKYDYLVIACGTKTNFFGNKAAEDMAFALKQVPQALNLRSHILQNFEKAVTSTDEEEIERLTNFVIVGGGPTGVELAGALGELKKHVLPNDYPELNIEKMKIYLVEGLPRLLSGMSARASERALKDLKDRFNVNVKLETMVKDFDGSTVTLGNGEEIKSETLIWAAGVKGVILDGLEKATVERSRYVVDEYNRVKGYENIYAIGDIAMMKLEENPNGHPQLAPVAMQQGKNLGKNLSRMIRGSSFKPFEYLDKGSMATIGRNRAVADLPGKLSFGGIIAWFIWIFIHLMYLVSFRQKLIVLGNWMLNYFTYDRGTRLIIRPYDYRRNVRLSRKGIKSISLFEEEEI